MLRNIILKAQTKSAIGKLVPALQITKNSFSTIRSNTDKSKNVVVVDGVRLPFATASSMYSDEMAVDLQRLAFLGLLNKTAIDKESIDYVVAGTVIQEVRTSNIAREAAINAGLPNPIGAHTVSMVRQIF